MGGFFGVASANDCVCDLFYGTDYHSHLGTRRGGLAVSDGTGRFHRRIHDITNAQFRSKFDDDIIKFRGKTGIGVISDGELNPTEIVAMLICRKDTIIEGIKYAQEVIKGSCSILLLIGDTIYAARDKYGRTPILLGKKQGAYAVSMESTAFPNLDYNLEYELGPGEILEITSREVICRKEPGNTMKICSFFWVYYGYPSSDYEGVNTESARYRNGASMAEDDKDMLKDIDSICGIPDSGIAHAIGYSNASGKPYHRSFVKYTPTWPRS